MENTPLSVSIIAFNEEANLPDCINSLTFADEVVVVDSGSSDNTVQIASSLGCKVFVEPWKGHSEQKNSAVSKCSHQWVLSIDADERIPAETKEAIIQALRQPKAEVYRFPRKNHIHNRWLKGGDFWPDWQIRLFKKTSGRFCYSPHERWITQSKVETINCPIVHYSFRDYSHMVEKMNQYSSIAAAELMRAGKRYSVLTPFIHGFAMFVKIYIQKRGFLDGLDGFVNAMLKAGGSFLKYAKLLELQEQGNQRPQTK